MGAKLTAAQTGSGYRTWADVETSSEDYAGRFKGEAGQYMLRVQADGVTKLLGPPPPGAKLLDVGGGHAQLAGPLALQGWKVMVFGSSDVCRARLAQDLAEGRVEFQSGDLARLAYSDCSFDVVVSVRLISHVDDWRALIAELCRLAGRSVVIDYPSLRSLNLLSLASFGAKKAIEKNTRTFRSFWPREIHEAFRAEGFEIVDVYPQFLLPMALHRLTKGAALLRGIEAASRALGLTRVAGNPILLRADRR